MTDQLREDVERAVRAKVLLEDPLLIEAFDTLRKTYIEAWETTKARETDERERLWQALQIVGLAETHLRSVLSSGEVAQKEIDNLERMGERRKVFGIV